MEGTDLHQPNELRLAAMLKEQARLREAAELSHNLVAQLIATTNQEGVTKEVIVRRCDQLHGEFVEALINLDARHGISADNGLVARGLKRVSAN